MRARRCSRCSATGPCPSSTRTTPWRRRSCATATTIGSPRAWRRWSAPSASCCCPTSMGCTRRIRAATRTRAMSDEVTELTREFYDMAGGPGSSARLGRHAHEDRGCAHRSRRRLSHVHRDGPRRTTDHGVARGRQGHLVPAERYAGRRAQAVDRRHTEAARHAASRRGRRARARRRAQPVAGGGHRRRGAVRVAAMP